jgi:hypothetical protein
LLDSGSRWVFQCRRLGESCNPDLEQYRTRHTAIWFLCTKLLPELACPWYVLEMAGWSAVGSNMIKAIFSDIKWCRLVRLCKLRLGLNTQTHSKLRLSRSCRSYELGYRDIPVAGWSCTDLSMVFFPLFDNLNLTLQMSTQFKPPSLTSYCQPAASFNITYHYLSL